MAVQISHSFQQFYQDQDFARVTATTREISRFGGGPMVQSCAQLKERTAKPPTRTKKNISKFVKLEPKVGSERRTEQKDIITLCELPDSADSSVYDPSTN